jgi:peptide chain release factor subunit 1
MEDSTVYGFVIIDGNGCLIGKLSGNVREVLHHFDVDLPKKHGRGGQSALRFARLRIEKRHNYVRKVSEEVNRIFLALKPAGVILAGIADLKKELVDSNLISPLINVISQVDISYGGLRGFDEAIALSADLLENVKYIREKKVVGQFFDEIRVGLNKVCYGIKDTTEMLSLGLVDTLIVCENLDVQRVVLTDGTVKYQVDEGDAVAENVPYIDWLTENYTTHSVTLEIISDKTGDGSQFSQGFGGIGGILRYSRPIDYDDAEVEDFLSDIDDYL